MPEEVFAARIQERRKMLGWSQVQLAKNLSDAFGKSGIEIDGTAITRIERGDRRVRLDEAVAIVTVMGLDLHEVIAPHPGGLEDQIERAHIAVENATYAVDFWQRELTMSQGRLDELRQAHSEHRARQEETQRRIADFHEGKSGADRVRALLGLDEAEAGDGVDREET